VVAVPRLLTDRSKLERSRKKQTPDHSSGVWLRHPDDTQPPLRVCHVRSRAAFATRAEPWRGPDLTPRQFPEILAVVIGPGEFAAPRHRVSQILAGAVAPDTVLAAEMMQGVKEATVAVAVAKLALHPLRAIGEKRQQEVEDLQSQ